MIADAPPGAIPTHFTLPGPATDIGPGTRLVITLDDEPMTFRTCTTNFVWDGIENGTIARKYIGTAGHCLLPLGKNSTHGGGADYDGSRTHVSACVANCSSANPLGPFPSAVLVALGPLAFARQFENGSALGNDFALVEVPAGEWSKLRPQMPAWGGPTGSGEVAPGSPVCFYGTGALFGDSQHTRARAGFGLSGPDASGTWFALMPGFQGDSGAGIVLCGSETGAAPGLHGTLAAGIVSGLTAGVVLDPDRLVRSGVYGTGIARAVEMARQAELTIEVVTAA